MKLEIELSLSLMWFFRKPGFYFVSTWKEITLARRYVGLGISLQSIVGFVGKISTASEKEPRVATVSFFSSTTRNKSEAACSSCQSVLYFIIVLGLHFLQQKPWDFCQKLD